MAGASAHALAPPASPSKNRAPATHPDRTAHGRSGVEERSTRPGRASVHSVNSFSFELSFLLRAGVLQLTAAGFDAHLAEREREPEPATATERFDFRSGGIPRRTSMGHFANQPGTGKAPIAHDATGRDLQYLGDLVGI